MKQISLKVAVREQSGSTASRHVRKSGRIPAVLYGPNGVRTLSIDKVDFRKLWKQVSGRTALIELNAEGVDPALSIIQEMQRDPLTDEFLHIDFKEILRGRDMWATIAIRIVGEAFGVRNEGAVLETHRHDVEVRCRPRYLPEIIEVDVTNMKAGDSIKVKDLPALEGVFYETDAEVTVASCLVPVVEEAAPAAAAEGAEGAAAAPATGAAGAAAPAAAKAAAPAPAAAAKAAPAKGK
jgi:large subunit ribosomal protein L25